MNIDFEVDDSSFGQQGSVPFKWEIKPGVPKNYHHCHCNNHHHHLRRFTKPSPPPQKLKPPPAGVGSPLLRPSDSISRSDRWRVAPSTLAQPPRVSPGSGCFPSPLLKRKSSKSQVQMKPGSEPDYRSEFETLSRWSISSRKSLSPFRESVSSSSPSSFSSYQSSPRPTSDTEWAGFGLF